MPLQKTPNKQISNYQNRKSSNVATFTRSLTPGQAKTINLRTFLNIFRKIYKKINYATISLTLSLIIALNLS